MPTPNDTAQEPIPVVANKFSRLSATALAGFVRDAIDLWQREGDSEVMALGVEAQNEIHRRKRECPKRWIDCPLWLYQVPPPKPFRYGMTPKRRVRLTEARANYPQYAREIHVWCVVLSAPYTTQLDLAEACAEDSDISAEAWRKVIRQMEQYDCLTLRPGGYVLGEGNLFDIPRPQVRAAKRMRAKIGAKPAPRDTSAKAKRVIRVIRYGMRTANRFSSPKSLARECAKNGSASMRTYEYTIDRLFAKTEIVWRDDAVKLERGKFVPDHKYIDVANDQDRLPAWCA